MKAWYAERVGDESVAQTWKHLHTMLYKKVHVRPADAMWYDGDETEDENKD